MDRYIKANLENWNDRVVIHLEDSGEIYDVDEFLAGASTLQSIELDGVGDVTGKSLLHLMCHFGLDTLSWARRGAAVTGVDISDQAIAVARKLARQAAIDATFVCSDVHEVPRVITQQFDVVFASYGVLCWLPSVDALLAVAARMLKPGGQFFLADVHPFVDILEYEATSGQLEIQEQYFHRSEPLKVIEKHSYTGSERIIGHPVSYQWFHPLSNIVNACITSGIQIRSLREFPYLVFNRYPELMEKRGDRWVFRDESIEIPMLFAIEGIKEVEADNDTGDAGLEQTTASGS